ncbi:MAG TPA: LysM peptidoglycan-binding domain-containing protein [Cytophagaceae bacterium]|nr:LysM peptidoglycan-binding domain-containing protein [Cytophagaceae bacterium]
MKYWKENRKIGFIALLFVVLQFLFSINLQAQTLKDSVTVADQDTVVSVDTLVIEQVKLDTLASEEPLIKVDSTLSIGLKKETQTDLLIEGRLKNIHNQMPLTYNNKVKGFIDYFCVRNKNYLLTMERRKNLYYPVIEEALKRWGLPDELKYLPIVESGLNPMAFSRVGAAGMWQFMPASGREYGLIVTDYIDERLDIYKSTEAACKFFSRLYNVFGDWDLCLASYNSGPGTVKRAIRQSGRKTFWSIYDYLPRETRSYVPQFVAVTYGMNYLQEYNIVADSILYPIDTDTILLRQFVNLHVLCEKLNVCYEDFVKLNPAIRTNILPDNINYPIRLPREKKLEFLLNQHEIMECVNVATEPIEVATNDRRKTSSGAIAYRQKIVHTVKKGEVVGRIASRYGVSVSQIRSWNRLKSNNIRIGQKLVIYKIKYTKSSNATIATKKPVASGAYNSKKIASGTTSKGTPKYYYVQPGDTLWTISKKYGGLSVDKIKRLNNIKGNTIKVGQKLILG